MIFLGIDTQAATQITSEMDTFDTQTDNDKSEEPTQMIKGIRNIF